MKIQKTKAGERIFLLAKILIFLLVTGVKHDAFCQTVPIDTLKTDSVHRNISRGENPAVAFATQYDVSDLFRNVFSPHKKIDPLHKKSGITVIPNIAANPTIGLQGGIKAVAGKKLGSDPNTFMSVAATSASITTKGILYFYINHNIYTPGNKWNLQGGIVIAKTVSPDYGLGIGRGSEGSEADYILSDPERKGYSLHSIYFNFREKVYKEIAKNLFIGAGVSFEVRRKIEEKKAANTLTPYDIYSDRYGFSRDRYSSDGLLFNVQYTTRDNQNRAYKGIYLDAGFRANQTWIGSTKNAEQFVTDFRKYWSLSARNPEHVVAFWNWGSYLLDGALPYMELPGSGKDGAFRSARGYKTGYFKGTKFNYSEVEYRFPIMRNKFISGVTFFNLQSANDEQGTKLFELWQPGGGAGFRVLFNKTTRTNLCLDYAFGKYGSHGFFLGLNEAF